MDMELTGNYPIIIEGDETGRVYVSREGLFWSFEASSDMTDGIIRLSVFGDEGEGYLGIMEPRENRMYLKKKLSRSGLRGFPRAITHAGRQGAPQMEANASGAFERAEAVASPRESYSGDAKIAFVPESESSCNDFDDGNSDQKQYSERPPPANCLEAAGCTKPTEHIESAQPLIWKICGCPAAHFSTLEGKNIFGSQKNVLEARDGDINYLALPERNANDYPRQQRLFSGRAVIMGEPYLICKTKNGRIL